MKTINTVVAFLSRLFESKWYYNLDNTMRINKVTGDVEYLWMDGMGNYWMDEPMFGDEYSCMPRKGCHLKVVQ